MKEPRSKEEYNESKSKKNIKEKKYKKVSDYSETFLY